jgi:hypothetical protein
VCKSETKGTDYLQAMDEKKMEEIGKRVRPPKYILIGFTFEQSQWFTHFKK